MPLPLRLYVGGPEGRCAITLAASGLRVSGDMPQPRTDLVVNLWDALVTALALDEIDLAPACGGRGHTQRIAEARAALQVRLGGRPRHGGK